jgi:hypothetical protein
MPRVTPISPYRARAILRWSQAANEDANKWSNTLDFRFTPGPVIGMTDVQLQALADEVSAAAVANLIPKVSAAFQLVRTDAYDLGDPSRAPMSNIGPDVGTGAATAAPLDAALCVTLRTAQIGRSYHGRLYIGGLDDGQNDATGQTWVAGAGTAADAFATACLSLNGGNFKLAVLSLRTNGAYRAQGVTADVTDVTVRTRPDGTIPVVSQRLRLESQRKRRRS